MKLITFAVPCYNSAPYMERCIETLLPYGNDVEIIIVNDGSTDNTGEIAVRYAERFPDTVRVVHQDNGGHGEAVNTGLQNARGLYFKVIDSDDWLDIEAMYKLLQTLKALQADSAAPDMVICNYVYEKVSEGTRHTVHYHNIFPADQLFSWDEMKKFPPWKYLLMHSVIYRTQLLHDCGIQLPKHTFYVDNLFVYKPLPYVQTVYYIDLDLYHYFIGREDQSVNENMMVTRIDQQLRVTRLMLEYSRHSPEITSQRLARYMINYLCMMITISAVFLRIAGTPESISKEKELWVFLEKYYYDIYQNTYIKFVRMIAKLPGKSGNTITIKLYRIARKVYKFN